MNYLKALVLCRTAFPVPSVCLPGFQVPLKYQVPLKLQSLAQSWYSRFSTASWVDRWWDFPSILLQDMDPHCIHGVLLLVERDLTFRMEKPTAGQVIKPFVQGLLGSSCYPVLCLTLQVESSESTNVCSFSHEISYFSIFYGCSLLRVWYLWGCKISRELHWSLSCCVYCQVQRWHVCLNYVSLLGPLRCRGFAGDVERCMEEPVN